MPSCLFQGHLDTNILWWWFLFLVGLFVCNLTWWTGEDRSWVSGNLHHPPCPLGLGKILKSWAMILWIYYSPGRGVWDDFITNEMRLFLSLDPRVKFSSSLSFQCESTCQFLFHCLAGNSAGRRHKLLMPRSCQTVSAAYSEGSQY